MTGIGHAPVPGANPRIGPAIIRPHRGTIVAATAATVLLGTAGALAGSVAVAALGVVGLVVLTAVRPAAATYLYLVSVPMLSGIERGVLLPLVRPNEAVLAILIGGALIGAYLRFLRGDPIRLHWTRVDGVLTAFVVAATIWPILSLMLRGQPPTAGEAAALMPVVKLVGVLVLARTTLVTARQQIRLLRIVVVTACIVAVVAVLQTLGFPPVIDLLASVWSPDESPSELTGRGTTMFASSIATGDYLVVALAVLVAAALRGMVAARTAVAVGVVLGAGVVASGQFSSWAAALVVAIVLARQHPVLMRGARRFLPLLVVAGLIGAPAAVTRIAEFWSEFGVPRSWLGRWDNLTNFYLPRFDPVHLMIGVSPDSVLPAPETWRELIYLEFGYLQLLWVGGVPLLLAFLWLSRAVLGRTRELRYEPGPVGVTATALRAAWWMVLVLSLIDVHLTLRGTGDVLFLLLGIVGGVGDERTSEPA